MGSLKETKKLCEELYKHLDKHFEYGIAKDGKLKTHVSNKDIAKYYRFQSPDEFKQNGGGICFDYVEYEEAWLKEHGVSCRKFYLITETPPDYDTHTFVVIETEGKFIWVESSMKNSQGVHIFSKLRDLLKMAAWGCFRGSRNKEHLNGVKYSVFEYTNNHPKYGCEIGEYMDWMIEHGKWVFDDMTKKEQPQIVEEAAAFSRRGVSGWRHTDATYEEKKNFERAMSFNSEIVYLRKEMNHMTRREIVQRLASLYNKLAEIYDNIEEDYTEVPIKTSRLGFARKPEKRSMSHRQYIDRLIYEIRDNIIELNRHFNRDGVKTVIQKMMDVWEYEKRELHINDHIGDKLVGNLTEKASHKILDKIMDSYVDKFYDNESVDDVYQEEVQTPPDRTKLIQDYQKDINKAVVDYQKLWEKTLMTLHQMKKVGGEPFQKMYDQLHDRRDQFIDDLKQTLPPGHLEKNKEPSWIKNIRTNTNMRFKLVKTAIDAFDSSPGMVKLVPLYQAFRMLFISMIEVCDFVPGVSIKVKLPYIPKINIHLASMTEPITSWDQVYQEAKLSTDDRNDLDDSQFGIPELRKYPLTDEKHVLQAVRFFNKAPDEYKEELAKNIVKRAKELGMDWENWESLKPYLDKKKKDEVVEESWQDRKNGIDSHSKKQFFHVSFDDSFHNKTLYPRIPSYIANGKYDESEDNKYKENTTTKRICGSASIEGCLQAIMNNGDRIHLAGKELYVYVPEKPLSEYKIKTNKEIIEDKDVFDANLTGEMWILESCKMKLYGTIVVDQISDKKEKPIVGDKDAKLNKYTFKWRWQVKPKAMDMGYADWEADYHDKCISYAMGVDDSIYDLKDKGFEIEEDDGDYCVTFDWSKRKIWEKYIESHIQDTYWNEYIRLSDITIHFMINENGKIQHVINHNYEEDDELLSTCNRLCEGSFKTIKSLIFSNDFYKKELKNRKVVQEAAQHKPMYFYHMIDRSVKLDDKGLKTPDYVLTKEHDEDLYLKMTEKYRYRLTHGWNIYPDKKPEELTSDQIYDGINQFRKSKRGNNQIYMFRYPPYKELGPHMADLLKDKEIYAFDINDPNNQKYINAIDWGWDGSNTDNKKLHRQWYENISKEDYFKKYDDNGKPLFAPLNHISIDPSKGFLPLSCLQKSSEVIQETYHSYQEAVDINSLRQQCQEVFQQASQIHYGCLDENGERITASPFKDSWKMISTYHSQSIPSMEQSKLGVCFEHSFYVAKLLKDRGLPCQTFFLNCNIDHTQPPEEDEETNIQQESESIAVEQHNNNDMSFWHQFTIVPNDTDSIVLIETSLTHEKNGVFLVENMDDVVSHLIQTFDLHLSQEDLQLMKQDLIDVSSFEPRDGDTYVGYINQVYLNGKFIKNEIRINHQTKTMKTYWQYLSDHKYLSDDGMKINEQIQQMDDNTAFDIINLLNATQLFTQEGLQFHQSFFDNDKIHMSVSEMESALKGFVQESYMGTNHNTLKEKYHYIPLTEQSVKKYKDQGVFKHGLRRVRVNDNTKGAIYIDENHIVVAYVAVEKKINGQRWITALEVSEEYQGHDYGVDLLQIAVDDFGATYLSVNKKNKRAFHMYKKYGWNVCDEDDHVFFMKLTERTDE